MLNTMSLNGVIGLENGNEDFLSDEGGEYVIQKAKQFGNIIWGRRAYENVQNNLTEFNQKLAGVFRLIVSANPSLKLAQDYTMASSPQKALDLIKSKGMDTAILDGGGLLNSSFLKAGLVDEVHLILEPVLVSKGLTLLRSTDQFEVRARLISMEPIHNGEILVKYKVEKR